MEWVGSGGRTGGRVVASTPAAIFLFFNSLETREDAPVEPGAAHLPTKNSFIRPFPCGAITIAAARSSLAWLHITSPTLQLSKSPRVMSATNFTSAARKAGANLRRGRSDASGQRVSGRSDSLTWHIVWWVTNGDVSDAAKGVGRAAAARGVRRACK